MALKKTDNFTQNYAALQKSVQRLRSTEVANIDELVGIIDEAVEAYKGCSARLEAIQVLTGEKLNGVENLSDEAE